MSGTSTDSTAGGRDLLDRISRNDPGIDVSARDVTADESLGSEWRAFVVGQPDEYPTLARVVASLDRYDAETGDGRDLPAAIAELGDADPADVPEELRSSIEAYLGTSEVRGRIDAAREHARLDRVIRDHPANVSNDEGGVETLTTEQKRSLLSTADAIADLDSTRPATNGHGH